MHVTRLASLVVLALVLSGCSAAAPSLPSSSAPVSAAPSASGPGARITVKLTEGLKIEPSPLNVPVGRPVTFVVTNAGTTDHEFFVGDEAAQAEHEKVMTSMGGMSHDEPNGIGLKAGQTKELTMTFVTGASTIAGCHIAGHFGAGMKATIMIGS